MKKKVLSLMSILVLSCISFRCSEEKGEIYQLDQETEDFIANVGDQHNEMVIDFFINIEETLKESARSVDEITRNDIIKYLDNKYKTNLRSSKYYVFNDTNNPDQLNARVHSLDFDPEEYLKSKRNQIGEYAFDKLQKLMEHSRNLKEPEFISQVIYDFELGVRRDKTSAPIKKLIY